MGRINTGSMGSDRAVHEHSENEPSPAWKQMEAADSSGYWVSKDTGANVKRITVSNPTQNVAGVLISNEPSLDAASTSRLFQNHFKGGNFLGIWDVTNGDANVVLDMHIVFVRLHNLEHPSPKTAPTSGSVASPASEFITQRPDDYQLSIQIICHSDGSFTTIILLDELSDASGPESIFHHVFDTDLRSLTTADSSTTRLSKCLEILNLHVGQVASEWESVYSQFSQATTQLLYNNAVIVESPSDVFLAQRRGLEARRLTSMLIIKLDRIVEALRSSRLDSRLDTPDFKASGRSVNEFEWSPWYGTFEKLLRVLMQLRSLETKIENHNCEVSLRHLSEHRKREANERVRESLHNGISSSRQIRLQHLNVTILRVLSPMVLSASMIQAGMTFGSSMFSFVVLSVLIAAITASLESPIRRYHAFTKTLAKSNAAGNKLAPHIFQRDETVFNKYMDPKGGFNDSPHHKTVYTKPLSNVMQQSPPSRRLTLASQLMVSARQFCASRRCISLGTCFQMLMPSQPVAPGHVLVCWKCKCGEKLKIQVETSHQSVAVEFARKASGGEVVVLPATDLANTTSSTPELSASEPTASEPSNSGDNRSISSAPTTADKQDSTDQFTATDGVKKYMLLCVNSHKYVILLENVDVTTVHSDEDLFNKLRSAYNRHRGDPLFRPSTDDRSFMGLLRAVCRNIRSKNVRNPFYRASKMQYIKLQVFPLKHEQDRVGGYTVDSIPSKEEAHRYKYAFSPCPPKFGRFPFPPDHFMHAFLKPGDHFESRYLAAQMLPKKLHQKLSWSDSVNDPDNVPEGWGFYIEEDIDRAFVALLATIFAALIALVAILWSCIKGDVQGGMGIGGFGVGLLAISFTIFMMVVFGFHC